MQKSCYKLVGFSDEIMRIMMHGNEKIVQQLWLGMSLCSTDALAL